MEEPTKGGSYVRNEDGSLGLLERTEPRAPRDKRDEEAAAAPAPAPATPAAAPAQE